MAMVLSAVTPNNTIVEAAEGGFVILHSTADAFYVGDSVVAAATGIPVAINTHFPINLQPNEKLYVFAASSTLIRVLRSA
jgi:hypothetical protein